MCNTAQYHEQILFEKAVIQRRIQICGGRMYYSYAVGIDDSILNLETIKKCYRIIRFIEG